MDKTVPSVDNSYTRTDASSKADELDMRIM